MRRSLLTALAVLSLALFVPLPSRAQCANGSCAVQYGRPAQSYAAPVYATPTYAAPTYAAPRYYVQASRPVVYQQAPAYQQAYAPSTTCNDQASFLAWLNGTRARYGLPAVGWDPQCANDAAANNAQQAIRGMGHWWMGCARRQNSAMGGGYGVAAAMWLNSPPHRAALLDPTIRSVGVAMSGTYLTFSAR